ncbi:MAG: HNH endonuclease [Gemmatimonadales bacterium]
MTESQGQDAEAASTSVTQWTRIDGVLVERDDLIKAISALRALPDSDTIIIKSLKDLASPLANTKYRLLADQYLRDHPEVSQSDTTGLKHPPVRRIAFIRMLERHLHKLDELTSAAGASGQPPAPEALDDTDARKRITRDVVARQGQAQFRDALIRAYEGRCAVTGCDSPYALEAAHIRPYLGEHTNIVTNGLLLRADIHALFDLGLLAVNPATRTIVISDQLSGHHYKSLQDRPLNLPAIPELHPDHDLLTERWTWFEDKQTSLHATS